MGINDLSQDENCISNVIINPAEPEPEAMEYYEDCINEVLSSKEVVLSDEMIYDGIVINNPATYYNEPELQKSLSLASNQGSGEECDAAAVLDPDYELELDEGLDGNSNKEGTASSVVTASEDIPISGLDSQSRKRRRELKEQMNYNKGKHPLLKPCNCKKLCGEKISETERKQIHHDFWSMERHSQRIWLAGHVIEEKSKRKCENGKRNYTRIYHLQHNSEDSVTQQINVCQRFFLSTLGYKYDSVLKHTLLSTKDDHGYKKHVPSKDRRGCTIPTNKKKRDIIINHINLYTPLHSHYKREHTPHRRFLPPDLTISIMYQDYCTKYPDNKISYEVYRKTLDEQNIGFYDVLSEKCSDCLEFDLNIELENRVELKEAHLKKANAAREQYKLDADNNNADDICVFAADLQKVVLLPRMPDVKASFFLSRLVTFNETFAAMGKKKGKKHICILWHEALAGRDAADVTCAFIKCLQQNRDCKTIIIWMDNCSGQNKNLILYSNLIIYVNQESCLTQDIILKYLVPGHTYMAADGLHGRIEQCMRKKKNVQDFDDFISICKQSSLRTEVVPLAINDFMNLENKMKNRNYNKNNTEILPLFKDIVETKFSKGCITGFEYKKAFNEDYIKVENLLKKKLKMYFPQPRDTPRGVPELKKANIITDLVGKMDMNRKPFWQSLPTNKNSVDLLKDGI